VSTFMVYVDAECEGGGTEFPRVKMPDVGNSSRWCEFLDCDERFKNEDGMGVTFKPISGNAVFWENLGRDGRGYEETFHAGLPVTKGRKIGLNIWSWGPARW
jgi:prolyl 4-hydroxylase